MWPFPVGYFEKQDAPMPAGEGRYRNYLLVASGEIDHALTHLNGAHRLYVEIAHSMVCKKDLDHNRLVLGRHFIRLFELTSAVISRLTGAQGMLKAAIRPSKIRLFLLALTGQKQPMVDLVALMAVIAKVDQDTEALINDVCVLAPKDEQAVNVFFVELAQTVKSLKDCRGSFEMVNGLLQEAQFSIVPERKELLR
jgi:hypothetical protein